MEYTNDFLINIEKGREQHNMRYGKYYWRFAKEKEKEGSINYSKRIIKRAERIFLCATLWSWDRYDNNKLLDLQRLNKCENHRFCPFCKVIDLAKARYKLRPKHELLVKEGYVPYMLTLTVPNCKDVDLKSTIDKLYKDSLRLFRGLRENNQNIIKFRDFELNSAVRVLEITYNKKTNTYHPHLHCIIYTLPMQEKYIQKRWRGPYSRKKKEYLKYSDCDIHIMILWNMINKKIRMTEKNYLNQIDLLIPDGNKNKFKWREVYQCDNRLMDEDGFNEVMKYTFKDNDIPNYKVFKTLVQVLENRRIRQTFGDLINVDLENLEDGEVIGIEQFLIIDKKESPQPLLVKGIKPLYTDYFIYKKISRRNKNLNKEIEGVQESN